MHMHTHHFKQHFPYQPALASFLLDLLSPFVPDLCLLLGQIQDYFIPTIFNIVRHVFSECIVCLIPPTVIIVQRFIQSLPSLHVSHFNHLNLSFLITKPTGSRALASLCTVLVPYFQITHIQQN